MLWDMMSYRVKLIAKDLPCYLNKTESVNMD